jgi:hypothetical protein
MALSGHVVGLLKEYMRDLVVQAEQEAVAHQAFGFSTTSYQPDRQSPICWQSLMTGLNRKASK